jgi:hypothetical protein
MTHIPIEERIARKAASLPPAEAEELMRSWSVYRSMYSNAELEELFSSHRLDRELRVLVQTEQRRIFDEDVAEAEDD